MPLLAFLTRKCYNAHMIVLRPIVFVGLLKFECFADRYPPKQLANIPRSNSRVRRQQCLRSWTSTILHHPPSLYVASRTNGASFTMSSAWLGSARWCRLVVVGVERRWWQVQC